MNTRGSRKQVVRSRDPADPSESAGGTGPSVGEPVPSTAGTSRAKAPRPKKMVNSTITPKKKAAPSNPRKRATKSRAKIVADVDPVDSEWSDVELESIVDPDVELERLRKRMAEVEAMKQSRNPLKAKQSQLEIRSQGSRDVSPPERRGNPAEGRSLGTFNGKTDLDTFLVRLETCSAHFGWSRSEKVRKFPFD